MLSKVQGTKISRDFLSFTPLQSSGGFRQNKLLATVTRSGFPWFHTLIFDFSYFRFSSFSSSYRVKEEFPELALGPQIAPSATCPNLALRRLGCDPRAFISSLRSRSR